MPKWIGALLALVVLLLVAFGLTLIVPQKEPVPAPSIPSIPSGWKSYTDTQSGVTFQYPATFGGAYIDPVDWPPKVQLLPGHLSCTAAGSENAPAGKTEPRVIGGTTFCVTLESEGAAGSIYSQYAYAFPIAENTAVLTFTLRFPQCANYPDTERTQCETERNAFNPDPTVGQIAASLTVGK